MLVLDDSVTVKTPFAGVHSYENFLDANIRLKTTFVMVTHDPDYAALAGRQIHLIDGELSR